MNIKPIKTDADYDQALERIDSLMNRSEPGTADGDELEVLIVLVRDYEETNLPMGPSEPRDLVRFMLEQRGLRQKDLATIMGSRSRASEFLSGKKGLSLPMIETVSEALKIRRDLLMPTGLSSAKVAEKRSRYNS